jgi:hypothetical protein
LFSPHDKFWRKTVISPPKKMLVNSDKFEESLVEKKKLITKARKFLELMENIN